MMEYFGIVAEEAFIFVPGPRQNQAIQNISLGYSPAPRIGKH
jgi:hypothetical protein